MNNNGVPFDIKATTKELNGIFREMMGASGDFMNMLIQLQDKTNLIPEEERLSPDPYGCEKLFVEFFITDEMRDDYPLIVRDFLRHEFNNVENFEDLAYFDLDAGNDTPEGLFNKFVLNIIVDAVNSGSAYAKALVLQLYKTYYKKEYKALKRFSSISARELISVAEPDGNSLSMGSYTVNIARVLFIVKLSSIQLRDDCSFIYAFLNDYVDRMDSFPRYSFADKIADVYDDSVKEIEERFDIDKLYKIEDKMSKFLGSVFLWLGFSPDYAEWCDLTYNGIVDHLATTLAILKKTYPKSDKEYSAEELVLYSIILHCAGAATGNHEFMIDELRKVFYGPDDDGFYEDNPPLFHPEDIQYKDPKAQNEPMQPVKTAPISAKEEPLYSEKRLLEELDTLRRKVHKLEADNNNLRVDLSEKRKVDEDNKNLRTQAERANRELAALRSYVYNLTEEDSPVKSESVEQMKLELKSKRIVIVGGHTNWVSKLKKEFPGWDFVSPEAGATSAVALVEKADKVYFFTDTISHAKYNQFVNAVRERKIPFSYIHGVNIEKNIRDIYKNLKSSKS